MSKKPRVWRRANTYGIYAISTVVATVIVYALLALSAPCAVGEELTIEVDVDAGTCELISEEVVTVTPPPEPPPPVVDDGTDLGLFSESAWSLRNYRIGRGVISSFSFTADSFDRGGIIKFINNMPHLGASGYLFRGWFSEEPNGPVLDGDRRCEFYHMDPNPWNLQWTQSFEDTRFDCNLGYQARELYLNVAVGCWEGKGNGRCTVGVPYIRDYHVTFYPEWQR